MRDTQPYLTAVPVDTAPELPVVPEDQPSAGVERVVTSFRGEIQLLPGAGPRVFGVIDSHPVMAGLLDVFLDRACVRRPELALSDPEWSEVRRGLVLVTSYASTGAIIAQTARWSLSFEASGDAVPTSQGVTADLQAVRTPPPQQRSWLLGDDALEG